MQGAIIQADAVVGKHCIVNTGASVDHECVLEDFVHISPHATLCGNVSVGEGAWIGAGATIIPGVKIGAWAVVGAGAVVVRDVEPHTVVAGVPAKVMK
jgi:sugar O-acyltransferase (sialic acid O-acetyltransferase NeuD family)